MSLRNSVKQNYGALIKIIESTLYKEQNCSNSFGAAVARYMYCKYHTAATQNEDTVELFNGSNTDGSFTTAVSNSFLNLLEKIQ